jgi:hypothetical protein
MSICGGCPYPEEAMEEGWEEDPYACQERGCTFEDAAYQAQFAYARLLQRYKELEKKYNELKGEKKD